MLFKGDEKLTDKERIILLTMAWLMVQGRNPEKSMIRATDLSLYSHFEYEEIEELVKKLLKKKLIRRVSSDYIGFNGAAKYLQLKVTTSFEVTHLSDE